MKCVRTTRSKRIASDASAIWVIGAGILCMVSGIAAGQSFPVKPIRLVTGGVGGGSDFTLRLIAQGLTASFGHQVVV